MRWLIILTILLSSCASVYSATHMMNNIVVENSENINHKAEAFVCHMLELSYKGQIHFSYTKAIDYFSIKLGDGLLLIGPAVAIIFIPDDIEIHVISECQKRLYLFEIGKLSNGMKHSREQKIHNFFDYALEKANEKPSTERE